MLYNKISFKKIRRIISMIKENMDFLAACDPEVGAAVKAEYARRKEA